MPPKGGDPNEIKYIKMKCVGGEAPSAAALAPKCAPVGMPPKKVGDDIAKATPTWKGIKIEVEIAVQNRQCTIKVIPTSAALILKALKEPARDRKKVKNVVHNGKLKLQDVIDIAKEMRFKSFAADFSGTVKEILGTCISIGCSVDGKSPKDITAAIEDGEIEIEE